MCYVQSLPDVWNPNIKAKRNSGPLVWASCRKLISHQLLGHGRHQCLGKGARLWHHQRSYLLRHIQQYLLGYDINRNLRSSVFDQVVILRVKSEIPFIKSGLASLALQKNLISIFDASLAIWPCVSKSLSTNEPSGKNGVEAVFNVQPLNSSYALHASSAKSFMPNCIVVPCSVCMNLWFLPRTRSTGVGSSISMCFLPLSQKGLCWFIGPLSTMSSTYRVNKVQCPSWSKLIETCRSNELNQFHASSP